MGLRVLNLGSGPTFPEWRDTSFSPSSHHQSQYCSPYLRGSLFSPSFLWKPSDLLTTYRRDPDRIARYLSARKLYRIDTHWMLGPKRFEIFFMDTSTWCHSPDVTWSVPSLRSLFFSFVPFWSLGLLVETLFLVRITTFVTHLTPSKSSLRRPPSGTDPHGDTQRTGPVTNTPRSGHKGASKGHWLSLSRRPKTHQSPRQTSVPCLTLINRGNPIDVGYRNLSNRFPRLIHSIGRSAHPIENRQS